MPDRAHITSVEAIKEFRTNLVVYLNKARPTVEEVGVEVMRTRLWLENTQRTLWETELRRRQRKLDEAEAELFSAKLSKYQKVSAAQQMAVQKARRAVEEAQAKLVVIKKWDREFENATQPLLKQLEKLNNFFSLEIPNASAFLSEIIDTLEAYTDTVNAANAAPAPGEPAAPPATSPGKS